VPWQNTKLESEGAEFLVLGHLLMHQIPAYKAYTNTAGYDLVATNPAKKSAARIQVKSRWRTGAPGFIIKNFDCEFVIVVKLNRGNKDGSGEVLAPEYYVFPAKVLRKVPRSLPWGRIEFKTVPKLERFKENWDSIREFLESR
jgi:hypothetical protein